MQIEGTDESAVGRVFRHLELLEGRHNLRRDSAGAIAGALLLRSISTA